MCVCVCVLPKFLLLILLFPSLMVLLVICLSFNVQFHCNPPFVFHFLPFSFSSFSNELSIPLIIPLSHSLFLLSPLSLSLSLSLANLLHGAGSDGAVTHQQLLELLAMSGGGGGGGGGGGTAPTGTGGGGGSNRMDILQ